MLGAARRNVPSPVALSDETFESMRFRWQVLYLKWSPRASGSEVRRRAVVSPADTSDLHRWVGARAAFLAVFLAAGTALAHVGAIGNAASRQGNPRAGRYDATQAGQQAEHQPTSLMS